MQVPTLRSISPEEGVRYLELQTEYIEDESHQPTQPVTRTSNSTKWQWLCSVSATVKDHPHASLLIAVILLVLTIGLGVGLGWQRNDSLPCICEEGNIYM